MNDQVTPIITGPRNGEQAISPFWGHFTPILPSIGFESLFQKPYAVVRLRGRLYRNRSRYFAPVSRRSIN